MGESGESGVTADGSAEQHQALLDLCALLRLRRPQHVTGRVAPLLDVWGDAMPGGRALGRDDRSR